MENLYVDLGDYRINMEKLLRALNKVSLLLKINLLIKLVLWSFFWSKKGVANHLGTSGGRGGG